MSLQDLINEYVVTVTNLDTMISNLDAELTSLDNEVTTIETDVLAGSAAALLAKLEVRRAAEDWQMVKTWGDFGVLSIKEWAIWKWSGSLWTTAITRFSDDVFYVTGMSIPVVPVTMVKINGSLVRTVFQVNYTAPIADPPTPGVTTVICTPGETALPATIDDFEDTDVAYQYYPAEVNWDADAGILADMAAFDLGYDQIHAEIDLNGTYGLLARKTNITTGRDVQVLNRAKYQSFVDQYAPYA